MQSGDTLISVEVRGLMQDPATKTPIVVLRDPAGERFLPIWIGAFEAQAIALALEGVPPERPSTHDLLASVLRHLRSRLIEVVISALRNGTFFAYLRVENEGRLEEIDARPSDAIALALRLGAGIRVAQGVFDSARVAPQPASLAEEEAERARQLLESLSSDELGKYKM